MNIPKAQRIAVIGGGISGLAAAHRFRELAPQSQVTLFEAGSRLGGVISTVHGDGFQVEQSADNFITTVPWGLDLCQRLGLTGQLVETNASCRRTFVVRRGRLHRLPDGFLMMAPTQLWPMAVTPILSPLGKLRAAMEYFIPPRRDDDDESMAQFVRRRLGRETFDRLVEPLVSAVYAADMEKLSVKATLSRFREMEKQHGSLIRAMRHQMKHRPNGKAESGARYSMFVTLSEGLSTLVDAITAKLPPESIRLNSPIAKIERSGDVWRLSPAGTAQFSEFDALIVTTPAHRASPLLAPIDAELASELVQIEYSGTAIVSLGYDVRQVGHPLDGMGAVVPSIENSPILACSFSSQKYPHRAPVGKTLLRVFVGGARRPDLAEMPDAELLPLVLEHLRPLLRIEGEPVFCDIAHWPRTMPQYHVGHQQRVARIEARLALLPGLKMAGSAFRGVGLPDCIHGGESAAEQILK
ncbi:MAG: protoporphyrinogen oxidase [Thermoguttaceae bacterium]|jgi:oxygen-dependent protoporphyrinogen oxidase